MLPKKRMEQDMEDGIETLVEGKAALQTFKQTLNLHLAKHIEKEMNRDRRDKSSCSDTSLDHARKNIPTKRRKTAVEPGDREQSQSMTFVNRPDGTVGNEGSSI